MSGTTDNKRLSEQQRPVRRTIERRVEEIFDQLRPELVMVLASGSACKVTINLAAGGKGRAEVVRFVDV